MPQLFRFPLWENLGFLVESLFSIFNIIFPLKYFINSCAFGILRILQINYFTWLIRFLNVNFTIQCFNSGFICAACRFSFTEIFILSHLFISSYFLFSSTDSPVIFVLLNVIELKYIYRKVCGSKIRPGEFLHPYAHLWNQLQVQDSEHHQPSDQHQYPSCSFLVTIPIKSHPITF